MFGKNKFHCITIGLVLVITVISITTLAAGHTRSATLYYSDINISLDGKKLALKSADGKTVEPFIIDGTTYLPVRAVGEALGLTVRWNGDSKTVYLSSDSTGNASTGEKVDLYDLTPYDYSNTYAGYADFPSIQSFYNRQKEYKADNMLYGFDGTSMLGWTKDETPSTRYVTYLLNDEYSSFQAYVAPIDNQGSTTFSFQDANSNRELKSVTLAPSDKPVQISFDVTGIDKLKITYSVAPHKFENSGYYYVENNGALYNAYLVK